MLKVIVSPVIIFLPTILWLKEHVLQHNVSLRASVNQNACLISISLFPPGCAK